MPVVELFRIDGPAAFFGVVYDRVADHVDPLGQRRNVVVDQGFRLGHGRNHPVSKMIHEVDQKVP